MSKVPPPFNQPPSSSTQPAAAPGKLQSPPPGVMPSPEAVSIQPAPRATSGKSVELPTILSIAAIGISGIAILLTLFGGQRGLNSYNLKTPVDTIRSEIEIERDMNLKAQLELEQLRRDRGKKELNEILSTLEVVKEAEFNGTKILFVKYKENGVTKHVIRGAQKEADSGLWYPKSISSYTVDKENKTLASEMKKWISEGKLGS